MLLPIVAGSLINVLLALPAPVILSILYPATSSYVILSSYSVILKTDRAQPGRSAIEDKNSVFLIILTIILILVNRLLTLGAG